MKLCGCNNDDSGNNKETDVFINYMTYFYFSLVKIK